MAEEKRRPLGPLRRDILEQRQSPVVWPDQLDPQRGPLRPEFLPVAAAPAAATPAVAAVLSPLEQARARGSAVGDTAATASRAGLDVATFGLAPVTRAVAGATIGDQNWREGARAFVEGMFGIEPDKGASAGAKSGAAAGAAAGKSVVKAAATPAAATAKAAEPSRAQKVQNRILDQILGVLSRPHSMREFNAVTGALPNAFAGTPKAPSASDTLLSDVAAQSRAIFEMQVAQAQQRAVEGKITEQERNAEILGYMQEYQQQGANLVGANPHNTEQAKMLSTILEQMGQGR